MNVTSLELFVYFVSILIAMGLTKKILTSEHVDNALIVLWHCVYWIFVAGSIMFLIDHGVDFAKLTN